MAGNTLFCRDSLVVFLGDEISRSLGMDGLWKC
jgi:hypothetical protein